jgi:hypothetical protein
MLILKLLFKLFIWVIVGVIFLVLSIPMWILKALAKAFYAWDDKHPYLGIPFILLFFAVAFLEIFKWIRYPSEKILKYLAPRGAGIYY